MNGYKPRLSKLRPPNRQDALTKVHILSVQAESIKAVEITSDSVYVLSANSPSGVSAYPNSIFVDNVTFEPAF